MIIRNKVAYLHRRFKQLTEHMSFLASLFYSFRHVTMCFDQGFGKVILLECCTSIKLDSEVSLTVAAQDDKSR